MWWAYFDKTSAAIEIQVNVLNLSISIKGVLQIILMLFHPSTSASTRMRMRESENVKEEINHNRKRGEGESDLHLRGLGPPLVVRESKSETKRREVHWAVLGLWQKPHSFLKRHWFLHWSFWGAEREEEAVMAELSFGAEWRGEVSLSGAVSPLIKHSLLTTAHNLYLAPLYKILRDGCSKRKYSTKIFSAQKYRQFYSR